MLILGIDTSTKICTCSIFDSENGVIAETSLSVKKNHSNIVMPIIDNLFKISDLTINDIDKIAVDDTKTFGFICNRYVLYNDSSISTFKEFQRFAKTKSRCS